MNGYTVTKDSVCFLSEPGHKNFLYPSRSNPGLIREGSNVSILPWIKIDGLTAVSAASKDVVGDFKNSSNKVIVWISQENIDNV